VYNLEVDLEHVYRVGKAGVWAHNSCTAGGDGGEPTTGGINDQSPRASRARAPSDGRLKSSLADHLVGLVEDNPHPLFESRYLGDPDLDLQLLEEALGLLDGPRDEARSDIARAQELARAWLDYRDARGSDFTTWCRDHRIAPPTGIAIYE
jgi:hypothetical protein